MSSRNKIMVYVSAIAVLAAPLRVSLAAPTISCSRGISFGRFIPQCNGTITVNGTVNNVTANNGCHSAVIGAPQAGICTAHTTIGTAVQDVRITITAPQLQFNNGGGGQVTLDNYRIQTAGGSAINTATFNAALLNPDHTFRVGGRLRFKGTEPSGSYSGALNIVVTSIP